MPHLNLLPLMLVIAGSALAQTERLSLTTRITDQKYCSSTYSDMALPRVALQLTYRNETSKTLILYRGSSLISYVLIAADVPATRGGLYELNMHVGWLTTGGTLHEGSRPGNEFIVLRPRETFKTKGDIRLPVALERGTRFLNPGAHVLQVVVETWCADDAVLDRLRNKWQRTGYLWGDNVRSEPMPFTVDSTPKVIQCK